MTNKDRYQRLAGRKEQQRLNKQIRQREAVSSAIYEAYRKFGEYLLGYFPTVSLRGKGLFDSSMLVADAVRFDGSIATFSIDDKFDTSKANADDVRKLGQKVGYASNLVMLVRKLSAAAEELVTAQYAKEQQTLTLQLRDFRNSQALLERIQSLLPTNVAAMVALYPAAFQPEPFAQLEARLSKIESAISAEHDLDAIDQALSQVQIPDVQPMHDALIADQLAMAAMLERMRTQATELNSLLIQVKQLKAALDAALAAPLKSVAANERLNRLKLELQERVAQMREYDSGNSLSRELFTHKWHELVTSEEMEQHLAKFDVSTMLDRLTKSTANDVNRTREALVMQLPQLQREIAAQQASLNAEVVQLESAKGVVDSSINTLAAKRAAFCERLAGLRQEVSDKIRANRVVPEVNLRFVGRGSAVVYPSLSLPMAGNRYTLVNLELDPKTPQALAQLRDMFIGNNSQQYAQAWQQHLVDAFAKLDGTVQEVSPTAQYLVDVLQNAGNTCAFQELLEQIYEHYKDDLTSRQLRQLAVNHPVIAERILSDDFRLNIAAKIDGQDWVGILAAQPHLASRVFQVAENSESMWDRFVAKVSRRVKNNLLADNVSEGVLYNLSHVLGVDTVEQMVAMRGNHMQVGFAKAKAALFSAKADGPLPTQEVAKAVYAQTWRAAAAAA